MKERNPFSCVDKKNGVFFGDITKLKREATIRGTMTGTGSLQPQGDAFVTRVEVRKEAQYGKLFIAGGS